MIRQNKLKIAPKKLNKKVGDIKVPTSKLDIKTLIKDTHTAV